MSPRQEQLDTVRHRSHRCDARAGPDGDAFARDRIKNDLSAFRVVLGQRACGLDDRDLGAEAAKRLPKFKSDRPAADHRQMRRQLGQIENGFVRKVGCLGDDAGFGRLVRVGERVGELHVEPADGRDDFTVVTFDPEAHGDQDPGDDERQPTAGRELFEHGHDENGQTEGEADHVNRAGKSDISLPCSFRC